MVLEEEEEKEEEEESKGGIRGKKGGGGGRKEEEEESWASMSRYATFHGTRYADDLHQSVGVCGKREKEKAVRRTTITSPLHLLVLPLL